jgi:hypothetical protein
MDAGDEKEERNVAKWVSLLESVRESNIEE